VQICPAHAERIPDVLQSCSSESLELFDSRTWRIPPTDTEVLGAYSVTDETLPCHLLGFCRRLSQCLYPKTLLMWSRYSPARRSFVILWISTVTSGTGGFIPLRRRSSNGSETFAKRFVQYGLTLRYSIFFVPAMTGLNYSSP
jgi:hypothetical protein